MNLLRSVANRVVIALTFAALHGCAGIQISRVPASDPRTLECKTGTTVTGEALEKGRVTADSCIQGRVFVDREYVVVFPLFGDRIERESWDVVIFPSGSPDELRQTFMPLNGREITLRGRFQIDRDCWSGAEAGSDDVVMCAPATRPIRFVKGIVWTTES